MHGLRDGRVPYVTWFTNVLIRVTFYIFTCLLSSFLPFFLLYSFFLDAIHFRRAEQGDDRLNADETAGDGTLCCFCS